MAYNVAIMPFVDHSLDLSAAFHWHSRKFQVQNSPSIFNDKGSQIPYSMFYNLQLPKRDWAFSLAFYQDFNQNVDWPIDWVGRFVSISGTTRDYIIQPSFSYRIKEKFSFGLGIQLHLIDLNFSRNVPNLPPETAEGQIVLNELYMGLGANFGFFARLNPYWSIGTTATIPVNFGSDSSSVRFYEDVIQEEFEETNAGFHQQLPWKVGIGATFSPIEISRYSFELNYIHYKNLDSFNLVSSSPELFGSIAESRFQRNAVQFKFGSEFNISRFWEFRFGVNFETGKAKGGSVTPDYTFNKVFGLTTGSSIFFSEVLEAYISFAYMRNLEVIEDVNQNYLGFGGIFDGHQVYVGLGMRFNFKENKLQRERIRNF